MQFLQKLSTEQLSTARVAIDMYGFCQLHGALDAKGHQVLLNEANLEFDGCCFSQSRSAIAYEAFLADLGPGADSYLRSRAVLILLKKLFGRQYMPVPSKSCFTYYFGGGHLAPHLDDIPGEHAVSMLTYLIVDSKATGAERPALDVYSRGSILPGKRRARIWTSSASVVLGYGAEVWHGRPPLRSEEIVVMINGSYCLDRRTGFNP